MFVLGIGLLILGFSLPSQQHDRAVSMMLGGVGILLTGLFALSLAISQNSAHKALIIALAAIIYGGFFGYQALSNEKTGTAKYHHNWFSKGGVVEPVTRATSPVKFRTATNLLWGCSGVCLCVAVVSFVFYRSLKD